MSLATVVIHESQFPGRVRRELLGPHGYAIELAGEEDWPPVHAGGKATWKETLAELDERHRALYGLTARMSDSRLPDPVPGKDHDVYFMLHGAIQHMVGCKAAKHILAINTDPDAPMVTKTHYAVIGDLHEIVPAVNEELRRRSAG